MYVFAKTGSFYDVSLTLEDRGCLVYLVLISTVWAKWIDGQRLSEYCLLFRI